jgi:dTDP-4-dehydrorhamnose reductase
MSNLKFLIIGVGGQLSRAFSEILTGQADFLGQPEMDLARPERILHTLEKLSPKAIINAAAYTAVDKAEEEEKLATTINGESVGIMAEFCARKNIPFMHYSTDYVFSGAGEKLWRETDKTLPLNAYGRSKLEGEELTVETGGKYLIFRTSWVYDDSGKNFLTTMLRLGKSLEKISIVGDQFGAPTYAMHLAKYSLLALEKAAERSEFPSGIYHMANSGVTNWCDFSREIFAQLRQKDIALKVKEVVAIKSSEYKTAAARPHNSRLDMTKLEKNFGIIMPHWKTALTECMKKI